MIVWLWALVAVAAPSEEPAEGAPEVEEEELVVAISPFAPFVTVDGEAPPQGFSIDLWEAISREVGLRYRYARFPDVAGKLGAVRAGKADVAIGGISITSERERTVDFTRATFRTGLDILLQPEDAGPFSLRTLSRVLTPGRLGIILGFFVLIVVSGHLVWWAERGDEAFDDNYVPGVFEGMYWAIVTASTVGYGDKAPVRWGGRIVAALVIVVSLPMFAVFTAELASTLTVTTLQTSIESEDGLRGRPVGVVEGTTGERATRALGARVRPFADSSLAVEALLAGRVDAVVHDAPNLASLATVHEEAGVVQLGNVFEPQRYAIVVPQGSDRREMLDQALLGLQEAGEWERIRSRWFEGDLGE